jgi:hypothetical protein
MLLKEATARQIIDQRLRGELRAKGQVRAVGEDSVGPLDAAKGALKEDEAPTLRGEVGVRTQQGLRPVALFLGQVAAALLAHGHDLRSAQRTLRGSVPRPQGPLCGPIHGTS